MARSWWLIAREWGSISFQKVYLQIQLESDGAVQCVWCSLIQKPKEYNNKNICYIYRALINMVLLMCLMFLQLYDIHSIYSWITVKKWNYWRSLRFWCVLVPNYFENTLLDKVLGLWLKWGCLGFSGVWSTGFLLVCWIEENATRFHNKLLLPSSYKRRLWALTLVRFLGCSQVVNLPSYNQRLWALSLGYHSLIYEWDFYNCLIFFSIFSSNLRMVVFLAPVWAYYLKF